MAGYTIRMRKLLFIIFAIFAFQQETSSLRISKPKVGPKNKNCKGVLVANVDTNYYDCSSVGKFPVAKDCSIFVHCKQIGKMIEPEADFCPDGENYILDRCVKSHDPDDCPQRHCPVKVREKPVTTTQSIVLSDTDAERTTLKPTVPPVLNQLHPTKSTATYHNVSLQSLLTINIFLRLCYYT